MVYFDTNVLLYAFAKNIDDINQGRISTQLVEKAIENDSLILSEITLCEFAFVSYKIDEDKKNIDDNLDFLSTFLQLSNFNINQRVLEILKDKR